MLRADDAPAPAISAASHDMAALFERHAAAVFTLAYRRTGDAMQADDITGQTFVQALQAIDRYEERGVPIEMWLLRIAANQATGHARRAWRELPAGDASVGVEAAGGDETDPAALAERWERAAAIRVCLNTLTADQRRALYLRYWQDYPVEQVAAHLGRSVGATKQLLHRTIVTLRSRMSVDGSCRA